MNNSINIANNAVQQVNMNLQVQSLNQVADGSTTIDIPTVIAVVVIVAVIAVVAWWREYKC